MADEPRSDPDEVTPVSAAIALCVARVAPLVVRAEQAHFKVRLTRAELHILLDACLDLQAIGESAAAQTPDAQGDSASACAARPIFRALALHAIGWTEPPGPECAAAMKVAGAGADAWDRLTLFPTEWRQEVVERLLRAPHVLPPAIIDELCIALNDLDDGTGEIPFLLTSEPKKGRGHNPTEARELEAQLWEWIFHEKGAGKAIGTSTALVAAAVSRTSAAVDQWRKAWITRDGQASVSKALALAEKAGRAGQENALLEGLAKRWREATRPTKSDSP